MKRKIAVFNRTLWIDSRLAKEYEKCRIEITGIHAEYLLLTEHITKDMSVSTKWLAEKLEKILYEELETGKQLADPEIQKKGFALINKNSDRR